MDRDYSEALVDGHTCLLRDKFGWVCCDGIQLDERQEIDEGRVRYLSDWIGT